MRFPDKVRAAAVSAAASVVAVYAAFAAASGPSTSAPPVRTDADRNATPLRVDMRRIGTLRPKDVRIPAYDSPCVLTERRALDLQD